MANLLWIGRNLYRVVKLFLKCLNLGNFRPVTVLFQTFIFLIHKA